MLINGFQDIEVNKILLMRKHKIIIDEKHSTETDNVRALSTIAKNIENLGFIFSKKLFNTLRYQCIEDLNILYTQLIPVISEMVGNHIEHKPLYKNFPQELISLSDLDIYLNAIVHYWTNGSWKPEYQQQLRSYLEDKNLVARKICMGTKTDFIDIFKNMMQAMGSLSPDDRNLLGWFIKKSNAEDLIEILPKSFPSKETLSLVAGNICEHHPQISGSLSTYFRTATDVLRLIASLSDGDISLASNTHFRNFKRKERRFLLSILNACQNLEEDMLRYKGMWIRVGEKLHPGDYSDRFPKAYKAFYAIRNGCEIITFNSKLENAIIRKDLEETLTLLEKRPGEFARKLDHLFRIFPDSVKRILVSFKDGTEKISSQVLLQLREHFKFRDIEQSVRSFFPKGNIAKIQVAVNTLEPLPKDVCDSIVAICENELTQRFHEKPYLGNVYISPDLKSIKVPLAQRASSRSLNTYARGSSFSINKSAKTIRAFIHWKNISSEFCNDSIRTDIDISLGLYDAEWIFKEHISYTNLRSHQFEGLYHSGDIVDAPNGASEFIDMDTNTLRKNKVRYGVLNVYSYSEQGFDQIPECFFGWMERETPASGEIFEPKTVVNKIDLTSPTTICLPVLFDLFEMKVYWMDISLRSNPSWVNNLEGNKNNVVLISKAMIELKKPNLFDLFALNVKARGTMVASSKEADLKFGLDQGDDIKPFDVELILSEYL